MFAGALDCNDFAGCPVHGFPPRVQVSVKVAAV
jgi:hypothetical protein